MAFTSLFLDTSTGSVTSGMGSYITDLSKTIGVDLFEEDIDNRFGWSLLVHSPDEHGTWSFVFHHCGRFHVLQDARQGRTHRCGQDYEGTGYISGHVLLVSIIHQQ